jgi:hypothetical protein
MKHLSLLFIVFLSVAATAYGTTSLTVTLPDATTTLTEAWLDNITSGTPRNSITELKLASAEGAYWNLANCITIGIYFDKTKAPALTTLDLSAAAFLNDSIPHNGVTGSSTFGQTANYGKKPANDTIGMGITTVILPENLRVVGSRAFYLCLELANINLPDGLTVIGAGAFQKTKLSINTLPNSLVTLSGSVFSSCANITEMTFPASLTSIGQYTFNATGLKKITFLGKKPPTIDISNKASFSGMSGIDVIIPAGAKTTNPVWLQTPWTLFKSVTESTYTGLNPSGVDEKNLRIYPAVATAEIHLLGNPAASTAAIYNTAGREVLKVNLSQRQDNVISVAQLPSGAYLLKTGEVALKFVKK